MDPKGNDHKAAGRPDGDLDPAAADARRRVFDAIGAGDADGVDPETARHLRYALRRPPDRDPDRGFANMRRNGIDSMLDRYAG